MAGSTSFRTPQTANETVPNVYPYPLGDFSIDEHRPIKVVVIGAGFSGIIAGIRSALILLSPLSPPYSRLQFPAEDPKPGPHNLREERRRWWHLVQ